jgi:hypothetical protein
MEATLKVVIDRTVVTLISIFLISAIFPFIEGCFGAEFRPRQTRDDNANR